MLCRPTSTAMVTSTSSWSGGTSTSKYGSSRIYRNDGKLNFTDVTGRSGLPGKKLAVKGVADVNQDGFPDLIVLEDLKPEIYLNDSRACSPSCPTQVTGMEAATRANRGLVGRCRHDAISTTTAFLIYSGMASISCGRCGVPADGRFEYANAKWGIQDVSAASVDDGHCFGDINGDGRLDVIGYTSTDSQLPLRGVPERLAPRQ